MAHPSPSLAPASATSPQGTSAQPHITPPAPTAQPSEAQPTQQSSETNVLNAVAPDATERTYWQKLNAGDLHWQYKIALRLIVVIVGLIGIGCTAWVVSKYTSNDASDYFYSLDDTWLIPWGLITLTVSVVWSSICILVFFMRRPNAPVHPGAQVGIDLILWLGLIVTAVFAMYAAASVKQFGDMGTISEYSSYSAYGQYVYIPSNDTWVWNQTQPDSSYYGGDDYTRSCDGTSNSYSYQDGRFATCAEQDAFVNQVWHDRSHHYNLELTSTVCQYIAVVIHFALFVWACVDTNRRNSRTVSKEAEQLAADIVMRMVKSGAIVQAPSAAQMRPMNAQMPPETQTYSQSYSQPHPQQWPLQQQGPLAGPSNEKGDAARFA